MTLKGAECCLLIILACASCGMAGTTAALVRRIQPRQGSKNGETRLTILGTGFSKNQFNFGEGNSHRGNQVFLVSETQQYECTVHKDGCTEEQIMCYTPESIRGEPSVRVYVDGDLVDADVTCKDNSDLCRFKPVDWKTPRIFQLEPKSGPPGTVVRMEGFLYTDRYKMSQSESSNGRQNRILRAYFNGQKCELLEAQDKLYGLHLDKGDYGSLICKILGTYVGNQNGSFIVSDDYGRSLTMRSVLVVNSQNEISMFQSYAVVSGVSPSSGSAAGGTIITVSGHHFDETDTPATIQIGGTECRVLDVEDETILCETAAKPQQISTTGFPGNRGANLEALHSSEAYGADLAADDVSSYGSESTDWQRHLDALYFWADEPGEDQFVTRTRVYFIPPSDNDYAFFIKADDEAMLFTVDEDSGDKTLLAQSQNTNNYWSSADQGSERMTLEGGKPYQLEVVHRDHSEGEGFSVAAHMFHTKYTAAQSSMVLNEQQILHAGSVVQHEIQKFKLEGVTNKIAVDEVQVVDIVSDYYAKAVFRLGMDGAYTGQLMATDTASTVRSALDNLLSIQPDSVEVTMGDISGGKRLTVTLPGASRGDWWDLEVLQDPSSPVSVHGTVSETTKGQSTMDTFQLMFNGVPTLPIDVEGSASDVKEALLNGSFSIRCPDVLTTPLGAVFAQSFEHEDGFHDGGERTTDVAPFCGRISSKNPKYLFFQNETANETAFNGFQHEEVCFAYKGRLQDTVLLHFYHNSNTGKNGKNVKNDNQKHYSKTFTVEFPQKDQWHYICMDVAKLLREFVDSDVKSVFVKHIGIFREDFKQDIYIDNVYIGTRKPIDKAEVPDVVDYTRLGPWDEWLIADVEVEGDAIGGYEITMVTANCADDLPLLQLYGGQVQSQSLDSVQSTLPGGASATTERLQAASPPIAGNFSLTFRDQKLKDIPASVTTEELQAVLQTLRDMGSVSVHTDGGCADFQLTMEWLTAGGDQPTLEVDDGALLGNGVYMKVITKQQGGVFFDPIPGDMLRTHHPTPQAAVTINNIPSICEGDCSFQWSDTSTPVITGIDPASGSSVDSTILVISGAGFSDNKADNVINIGGEPCIVIFATSTDIECQIGQGPAGAHLVNMYVQPAGNALHSGQDFYFSYLFEVDGIVPTSSSLSGGQVITVTGTGFSSDIGVLIGDAICDTKSTSYTSITCDAPARDSDGTVDVVLTDGSFSAISPTQFTYSSSLTPKIMTISESTAAIQGGTPLLITVSEEVTDVVVKLGGKEADVTGVSGALIEVSLPALGPGSYPLSVWINGMGYADIVTNSIPNIQYTLRVDSISPRHGSLRGGTKLTIQGSFSTHLSEDHLEVTLDDVACDMETASVSEVVCTVGDPGVTHGVTNEGEHVEHGKYYRWDPHTLDIYEGDTVEWRWSVPSLISGVAFRVQQTDSATSVEYNGWGFTSGLDASSQGQYSHRFTQAGTYYYSSGPVDSSGFVLHGTVIVAERPLISRRFSLKVNDFEAFHNIPTDVENPPMNANICSVPSTLPYTDESGAFYIFTFTDCFTPTVVEITPTHVIANGAITIHGSRFSTVPDQNTVQIKGDSAAAGCAITFSSETTIECQITNGAQLDMGIPLEVEVIVSGQGVAMFAQEKVSDRKLILTPFVDSVHPNQGSTKGNTLVTISGGGFGDDSNMHMVTVVLANTICSIQTISHGEITCLTANSAPAYGGVEVTVGTMFVVPDGSKYDSKTTTAECTGTCVFSYSEDATPVVHRVSPSSIVAVDTSVTITGQNFGSSSEPSVYIGHLKLVVEQATETEILCALEDHVVGTYPLYIYVPGKGDADTGGRNIAIQPSPASISPPGGSLEGGTNVTIKGFGFHLGNTSVKFGDASCEIIDISPTEIKCRTSKNSETTAEVKIISNDIQYPALQYEYSSTCTPGVTLVTPAAGTSSDVISISGSGFGHEPSNVRVMIGGADCDVISVTDTDLSCATGDHIAGEYDLLVTVSPHGYASGALSFQYEMEVTSITPNSGSQAGGQLVTLSGKGLDVTDTMILICGEKCTLDHNSMATSTQLVCSTPPQAADSSNDVCSVETFIGTAESTIASGYTYSSSSTPVITKLTPARGGTAGGTRLTLQGSGFGSTAEDVIVTLAGTNCPVETVTDSEIICVTESHTPCVVTPAEVRVGSQGNAIQGNSTFEYVDLWSSPFTWDHNMPKEGAMVVIPTGMTVMLDTDTPVIKLLLIKGGKLIFDEADVELNAEIILITDGGVLQVGTEAEPFQHKAYITLHGHVKSQEIPIYGTKVIAVRNGTLDLHGKPVGITWTRLESTVDAGENQIHLQKSVQWQVGDEIVIATTGDRHSQRENEARKIVSISDDGHLLELDEPLEFKHRGEVVSLGGGHTIEIRAEVGLLTRNVVFRGNDNLEWHDVIEACPKGFNTGEFATQTCFQGRFGEEIGSDQFGSQILLHAPVKNQNLAVGRIENVEVTYAGQAFRLGRYAIHFHLNGDMSGSYVRGCAIHQSFNRAVNIHGSHNIMVEHNVIYDVMGGAFFTEDGVETGNVFQYNLAVFVKSSTSLLNDDITPAAFWATNPNNTYRHNAVAGGTHFGFWFRLHEHPDGPSADNNICPRNVPLGGFANNTVHSQGWFGLWIFQVYHPMVGGGCNSVTPAPAKFYGLTAWHCEKGAESVEGGAIQFHDFLLYANEVAGAELKLIAPGTPEYSEEGSLIADSIIAARDPSFVPGTTSTTTGIILPYLRGFLVRDVTFLNFDLEQMAAFGVTTVQGTTEEFSGGFNYNVKGLAFVSSPQKVRFRWEHEAVLFDMDGSLTGEANQKVVACTPNLPPTLCQASSEFSINTAVKGCVCESDIKFHRFSFNNAQPAKTLAAKNVSLTNAFGTSEAVYMSKRVTHKDGWMALLLDGHDYVMTFGDTDHITTISYTGTIYDMGPDDYVIMGHSMTQALNNVTSAPGYSVSASIQPLDPSVNVNGDWFFDNTTMRLSFLVSGVGADITPAFGETVDREIDLKVSQCPSEGSCGLPTDIGDATPGDATSWSEDPTWDGTEEGYGGNNGDGTYSAPLDYTDVIIPADKWVVADVQFPVMNKLYIYGVLQLDDSPDENGNPKHFVLTATHIVIFPGGRLMIGLEDDPFLGQVEIVLRGSHLTEELFMDGGPPIGAKALAVMGGDLDIHGVPNTVQWTQLEQTASAGDHTINLSEEVDWPPGAEVVIVTTSYRVSETEVMTIESVSDDKTALTLTESLAYKHVVTDQPTIAGKTVKFAAEVGLLSKNVKIIGGDYTNLEEEAFGARVIVSSVSVGSIQIKGSARISNVEFYHTGQEGFTDAHDPRFSFVFSDLGDVLDESEPSYLCESTFHHGFSPAIGLFYSSRVNVSHNVIHRTVGSAMQVVNGDSNTLLHNLVTTVLFPGTFNGREDPLSMWDSGILDTEGTNTVLQGNVVAGSERAGFHTNGQPCGGAAVTVTSWQSNIAHSCLIGFMFMPENGIEPCTLIANVTAYHNWDFGIYYQTEYSVEIVNYVSADNGLGLFPIVLEPPSLKHEFEDKYVKITDSVFIGTTVGFDCSDEPTPGDRNIEFSAEFGRSWRSLTGGKVGLSFATFLSGSNKPLHMGFIGTTSYQAIRGLMTVSDVVFRNFGDACGNQMDYVITTNPDNDDAQHPVRFSDVTLIDVLDTNKIFIHRANVGKINQADCIDMDCDGLKKAMLDDLDGSFLGGSSGTIIPQSEYEWDGEDRRRGVGDYRIPKTALTDKNNKRISVTQIAPMKGIIRDGSCQYVPSYQAYECHGLDYEMLMIESMDEDTETRRISPIAIISEGYVDLINGPQDHGWCHGYTCQKRLSTFPVLVAAGKEISIFYTGRAPQDTRLHFLNTDVTQAVVLAIFYEQTWRLDISVNGVYMLPLNGYRNTQNQVLLSAPNSDREFVPDVSSGQSGENYFDAESKLLYVLVRGSAPVDIVTSPTITISLQLPVMTIDEFFGEKIVSNLALFLGIPPGKIRFAHAVRETRRRNRRDLDDEVTVVTLEISNVPGYPSNDDITASDALELAALIKRGFLDGTLVDALKITVLAMTITDPPPIPGSQAWTDMATLGGGGDDSYVVLELPEKMVLATELVTAQEGHPFRTQPSLRMLDAGGRVITSLGSSWKVEATLRKTPTSHHDAVLDGNYIVAFHEGVARFSGLFVDHHGDYMLDFNVISPASVTRFGISSDVFKVAPPALIGRMREQPRNVTVGETFSVTVEVVDEVSGARYRVRAEEEDYDWVCQATLYLASDSPGSLHGGDLSATVDPTTGVATFRDLSLTQYGRYFLKFNFFLKPERYLVLGISESIDAFPEEWGSWESDVTFRVTLKFNVDYDKVVRGGEEYFIMVLTNYLWQLYPTVYFKAFELSAGSIIANFTMTGSSSTLEAVLSDLWGHLDSMTLTFNGYEVTPFQEMWVDGKPFQGPVEAGDDGDSKKIIIIVVVVVIVALILAAVAAVLIYKCYHGKGKDAKDEHTAAEQEKNAIMTSRPPSATSYTRKNDIIMRPPSATSYTREKDSIMRTHSAFVPNQEKGFPTRPPSATSSVSSSPSLYKSALMRAGIKLGAPCSTALYGDPDEAVDTLAGPDPVVSTPPGTPRIGSAAGSSRGGTCTPAGRVTPSGLFLHVSPAPSRCQTPRSDADESMS